MARKEWNHEPESLPLTVNPLFTWPLDPKKILAWYWGSWFPISVNLVWWPCHTASSSGPCHP